MQKLKNILQPIKQNQRQKLRKQSKRGGKVPPRTIAKQIIDFNKANFDNAFNAIILLQDHSEQMVGFFLEKATFFPPEGKKVITEWLESYKKGSKNFKDVIDNSFKTVEDYFVGAANAMGYPSYGFTNEGDQPSRQVISQVKRTAEKSEDKSGEEALAVQTKSVKRNFALRKKTGVTEKPTTETVAVFHKTPKTDQK
jgi:hypothetical protein